MTDVCVCGTAVRPPMFSSVATAFRRLVLLMLLATSPPSRQAVDGAEMRTTCFQGYFNLLRCSPWISWFATFVVADCDHQCKATGKHQYGACVRHEVSCLTGMRMLYVCHCTG